MWANYIIISTIRTAQKFRYATATAAAEAAAAAEMCASWQWPGKNSEVKHNSSRPNKTKTSKHND